MLPDWLILVLVLLPLAAVGMGFLGRAIMENPRGDFETGAAMLFGHAYVRLVHRLRIRGTTGMKLDELEGPLIVVSNHTAGVDPLLIQAALPFEVRWMMAFDMKHPALSWVWDHFRVIFVGRPTRNPGDKADGRGVLTAIRHLKGGGVIGVFPEGAIERPPKQVLPMQAGVGLLVKKTGARVLTVTLDGTPQVDPAWTSLWTASASVVHVRELIDYGAMDLDADGIAEDLTDRFMAYTGWPLNDRPLDFDAMNQTPAYPGRPVELA